MSSQSARQALGSSATYLKAVPSPEQWTLVKEVSMENRDPCEVSLSYYSSIAITCMQCYFMDPIIRYGDQG